MKPVSWKPASWSRILLIVLLMSVPSLRANDDDADDEGKVCRQAMDLLSAGKQSDAEQLIFTRAKAQPSKRIMFFAAVLVRSRFEVRSADKIFRAVRKYDPDSLEGLVSGLVTDIDAGKDTDGNFIKLNELANTHDDDPLVLWMSAVECRQLNKIRIGIKRYAKLLKAFDPGPALMHQTYGNLLLEDHQADKALEQYDIAIKMEPASWDYNCRGNALMALNRLDEAAAAYQKATELNPNDTLPWENWALLCDRQGDTAGAAAKRAKLAELEAKQQQ
jgi:tetratricopeptide (TPR) repeat protein